jgi:hypothetical protein
MSHSHFQEGDVVFLRGDSHSMGVVVEELQGDRYEVLTSAGKKDFWSSQMRLLQRAHRTVALRRDRKEA